jgi:hypothetical protein
VRVIGEAHIRPSKLFTHLQPFFCSSGRLRHLLAPPICLCVCLSVCSEVCPSTTSGSYPAQGAALRPSTARSVRPLLDHAAIDRASLSVPFPGVTASLLAHLLTFLPLLARAAAGAGRCGAADAAGGGAGQRGDRGAAARPGLRCQGARRLPRVGRGRGGAIQGSVHGSEQPARLPVCASAAPFVHRPTPSIYLSRALSVSPAIVSPRVSPAVARPSARLCPSRIPPVLPACLSVTNSAGPPRLSIRPEFRRPSTQALASEVVKLEENALQLRSRELKLSKDCEAATRTHRLLQVAEDPTNGCQIGTQFPILHAKKDRVAAKPPLTSLVCSHCWARQAI